MLDQPDPLTVKGAWPAVTPDPWTALDQALAARAQAGGVRLWWRDDDAVAPTPALDRLLAVAEGLPIGLAVIPTLAEPALAAVLRGTAVTVLQHGIAHQNHAPAGARGAELGLDRPMAQTLADLAAGRERLVTLFGPRFRPVLVPPWNRIAPDLVPALPGIGLTGLSTFGPEPDPVTGLIQVNAHLDPIRWKLDRRSHPPGVLAQRLADLVVGRDRPIGILTHHLLDDPDVLDFMARLIGLTRDRPGIRWCAPDALFP